MDAIYHEKQEGQLCAQHCLNNLLQGSYFNPIQLADIAHRLDEVEKAHLTEGDIPTTQMLRVMEQPSTNMDDSGFFSVQVISEALKIWNLEITPLTSPRMKQAMDVPVNEKAFICNHELHWITIRKLGKQWFNLNSLKKKPEFITNTYLSLFLAQLQMEGYSIFVVTGNFPACEADELLTLIPLDTDHTTHTNKTQKQEPNSDEEYEMELAQAISASLSGHETSSGSVLTEQELREKRIKHFEMFKNS